jgi:ATP-dependent Lon protease
VAKSIARAMGRIRPPLAGRRQDEADIHDLRYVGAIAGRIIQDLKQAGSESVFLLDEVDKLGVSFQGDPASALLEVLDPAQNDSFTDHYLGVPFDLSEVLFIATANYLQNIPGPLLDRMEVVEFTGYTEREKLEIAKKYLVPRQFTENGVTPGTRLTDDAISGSSPATPGVGCAPARARDRQALPQGGAEDRVPRSADHQGRPGRGG